MIKLGSVPFLNARPLIHPLETGLVKNDFKISYFDPSHLSEVLFDREVDVGLIPVAEFLKRSEYVAVPNISISSVGRVDSVVVLSRGEMRDVNTVAVDSRSQSSTGLLKVIFEIFLGVSPEYIKRAPGDNFLDGVDAGMLIGNSGLKATSADRNEFEINDLGEIWTDYTGLPFVYAVFALRSDFDLGRGYEALLSAMETGRGLIPEIASGESAKLGISKKLCELYLSERIKFDLDQEKIRGLREYQKLLFKIGNLEKLNEIKFYG